MDGDDRFEPAWRITKEMYGFVSKIRMTKEIVHVQNEFGRVNGRDNLADVFVAVPLLFR